MIYFGIEVGGNKSKDTADAINHSLSLFEQSTNKRLYFCASTIHIDGGGTNESLVNACVLVN